MNLRRVSLLPLAVAALTGAVAQASPAGTTFQVSTSGAFVDAVAKAKAGDTIQLAAGSYDVLTVKRHSYKGAPLTITGPQAARVDGLRIDQSSSVTVSGISITPTGDDRATLSVTHSSNVVVDHVLFDGQDETLGTGFYTDGAASNVTLQNSELTNCGEGARCVAPGATSLVVKNNNFHDCFDCDFIRGGGSNVTIWNNTFDRATPGYCVGGASV